MLIIIVIIYLIMWNFNYFLFCYKGNSLFFAIIIKYASTWQCTDRLGNAWLSYNAVMLAAFAILLAAKLVVKLD